MRWVLLCRTLGSLLSACRTGLVLGDLGDLQVASNWRKRSQLVVDHHRVKILPALKRNKARKRLNVKMIERTMMAPTYPWVVV